MPSRLPTTATASTRAILRLHSPVSTPSRQLSTTRSLRSAHGEHESQYDPPTGWLWGIPPGKKYEKEGWEGLMLWGFGGSMLFGVVGYIFKPDTSIQTWALEEARRRLESEGILEDPEKKSE
ncbi:MAG: hypothetical protein M1834_005830 [Cirrosporium novae-zelandiae]|nr:MAG: hypothetical protein M1834_005830 [Cirrosporium novae-zelandiae]